MGKAPRKPDPRKQLESAYDRLYALYESGEISPEDTDRLYDLDAQLRPGWEAQAARDEAMSQPMMYDPEVGVPGLGILPVADPLYQKARRVAEDYLPYQISNNLFGRPASQDFLDREGLLGVTGVNLATRLGDAPRNSAMGNPGQAGADLAMGTLGLLGLAPGGRAAKEAVEGGVNAVRSVVANPPARVAEFLAGESGAMPVPFGRNWSDVYHWSRSPEGFSEFDPNVSTSVMSQLGPHVGTKQAAEARYMGYAKPSGEPAPLGFTMPLKADLQKPFMNPATGEPWSEMDLEMFISAVADEQGVDRRSIAPFMRQKIAEQGYTSIPYRNDVEDAGSLSHIMMTEGRPGDAVLRSRFAGFDPSKRNLKNLNASLAAAGVPLGLLAMQPEEEQY